ncbi:MAG: extracellular solute-binding protein [Spirochaetia bacterium]|jgi:multiple sugar transport system substrate-binding protein
MKRLIVLVSLILMVFLCMPAFAGGKQEAATGEKGVTITVAADENDLYAWFQDISNTIYTPQTGVKVVIEFVPEYRTKKYVILQAGETKYDIYKLDSFEVPAFVNNGWLVPVDSYMDAKFLDSQLPGLLDINRKMGGQLWGTSYMNSGEYMYVNTVMLSKLGMTDPPKTWNEFYDVCKKAKQAGILVHPYADMWPDHITWERMLQSFGAHLFDAKGNATFNTKESVDALNYMKKLYDEDLVTYETGSIDKIRTIISNGDAMFNVNWDYQTVLLEDPKESKVVGQTKIMMMPGLNGPGASIIMDEGLGISKFGPEKNRKAAADWLKWIASPEIQKKMAMKFGWFPTAKSVYDDPEFLSYKPDLQVKMVQKQISADFGPQMTQVKYMEFRDIVLEELAANLSGTQTAEQTLANMVSRYDKIKVLLK